MFVPFLVFLNPSWPHDRYAILFPTVSVKCKIVLFLETFIWQIGMSANFIPWNNWLGVSSSGKSVSFLTKHDTPIYNILPTKTLAVCTHGALMISMSNDFSPWVPVSLKGIESIRALRSFAFHRCCWIDKVPWKPGDEFVPGNVNLIPPRKQRKQAGNRLICAPTNCIQIITIQCTIGM